MKMRTLIWYCAQHRWAFIVARTVTVLAALGVIVWFVLDPSTTKAVISGILFLLCGLLTDKLEQARELWLEIMQVQLRIQLDGLIRRDVQ